MLFFIALTLPDLQQKIENGEKLDNFEYIKDAQYLADSVRAKVKSMVLYNHGKHILDMPTKHIFQVPGSVLEDVEQAIAGYSESFKTPIAVGVGEDLKHAWKANAKSVKSGEMEFWHPLTDKEEEVKQPPEDLGNEIADKRKVEDGIKEVDPVSAEDEIILKEQLINVTVAAKMQAMEQAAPQQPQAPTSQEAAAQQQAAQQTLPPEEEAQAQEEMQDPRAQMMAGLAPEEQVEPQAEPEMKSDMLDTEMDPSKSEMGTEEKKADLNNSIAGLLATIKLYLPELMELASSNPEAFKSVMKLTDAAVKMAKSIKDDSGERLLKTTLNFEEIKTRLLSDLKKNSKAAFKTPPGVINDKGQIKIKDPVTKKTSWRGARTGLVMGPDGQALSTKTHNEISEGNQLGKEEKKSSGSKVIGYTSTKKPVYADWNHPAHQGFSSDERGEAAAIHNPELKEVDNLEKAKIFDFKSGKMLRDTGDYQQPTKRQSKPLGPPEPEPKKEWDYQDIANKVMARYGEHTPEHFIQATKSVHSEPYSHGDVHNVAWNPSLDKESVVATWNRSMPVPRKTHKDLVRGVLGKEVHQGGTDPLAWMDRKYGTGMDAIKQHKDQPLHINTRSDLIATDEYLKELNPKLHSVNIHIPSHGNENLSRLVEAGAPSITRRLEAVRKLSRAGIPVSITLDDLQNAPEGHGMSESIKRLIASEVGPTANPVAIKVNPINLSPGARKRLARATNASWDIPRNKIK